MATSARRPLAVARGGGFTPAVRGGGSSGVRSRGRPGRGAERCAVGPRRPKRNDALSGKPERCAVGPQLVFLTPIRTSNETALVCPGGGAVGSRTRLR